MRKSMRNAFLMVAAGSCLALSAGLALGDAIVSSPDLPVQGTPVGVYPYYSPFYYIGTVTYPYYGTVLTDVDHIVVPQTISPVSSGGNSTETFSSQLVGQVSVGGGPNVPFDLAGPVSVEELAYTEGETGTFSTQMLSMDLTGNVGGNTVEVTLDPTQLANDTGATSVTSIGGGEYDISSFFDVFTDLSINSGPAEPSSSNVTETPYLTTVPEPASLSLLGVGAFALCMRRRRSA